MANLFNQFRHTGKTNKGFVFDKSIFVMPHNLRLGHGAFREQQCRSRRLNFIMSRPQQIRLVGNANGGNGHFAFNNAGQVAGFSHEPLGREGNNIRNIADAFRFGCRGLVIAQQVLHFPAIAVLAHVRVPSQKDIVGAVFPWRLSGGMACQVENANIRAKWTKEEANAVLFLKRLGQRRPRGRNDVETGHGGSPAVFGKLEQTLIDKGLSKLLHFWSEVVKHHVGHEQKGNAGFFHDGQVACHLTRRGRKRGRWHGANVAQQAP
mmetsp:Transcript_29496/g.81068  ORF Transcript_29496/g.81068 Transcript_29496/m.81068 type:complete len:264 (+) Transcript_29496:347-1138(+)